MAREEIFGPVLTVIAHDGDDDAVRIANDSPYGLSGTVFSADPGRAQAVASRLRVGTVNVNGGVWYSPDVPFGGYKQSGVGREMGWPGSRSISRSKPSPQRSRRRYAHFTPASQERGVRREMGEFDNKVAIVTGAGGGIGQAYAEAQRVRALQWW